MNHSENGADIGDLPCRLQGKPIFLSYRLDNMCDPDFVRILKSDQRNGMDFLYGKTAVAAAARGAGYRTDKTPPST